VISSRCAVRSSRIEESRLSNLAGSRINESLVLSGIGQSLWTEVVLIVRPPVPCFLPRETSIFLKEGVV
jgi:hypothetical protein